MKFLIDFFPLAAFFIAYKMGDIYSATAVLMAATVLQTLLLWRTQGGQLQTLQKVTLVMILGFGALTLGLHDDRFIKWKPTVLYAGMGMGLWVAQAVFKKNPLQAMLGQQLSLPLPVWQKLGLSWIGYCAFMAIVNGYVAAYWSTDEWVQFKLWGYVFPLVFLVGQGVYISRHVRKDR